MGYALGVDLGTSFTAAGVLRVGRAEIVPLGGRQASIPSVVFAREDGTILVGEVAERRAVTDAARVAREFKRRVGDPTPMLLGGAPWSAEALMAKLLEAVVAQVREGEGGSPDRMAVCHPANWGGFKLDLLRQAVWLADLPEATFVAEPEAAAIHYAALERVEPGELLAVYDLGGGTFDAALLRRTPAGFDMVGKPLGIERLGGIDFDAAVFGHVAGVLGGPLQVLDPDDPATVTAVARLREECVHAKEALSFDNDVEIPVLLPNLTTTVRLTRGEFEAMIRPAITETVQALARTVLAAGYEPAALGRVLLVGGSSRIPLVAQLVSAELDRPVAVDAHPKHGMALGAAIAARRAWNVAAATVAPPLSRPPPPSRPPPRPTSRPPPPSPPPPPPTVPTHHPPAGRAKPWGLVGIIAAAVVVVLVVIAIVVSNAVSPGVDLAADLALAQRALIDEEDVGVGFAEDSSVVDEDPEASRCVSDEAAAIAADPDLPDPIVAFSDAEVGAAIIAQVDVHATAARAQTQFDIVNAPDCVADELADNLANDDIDAVVEVGTAPTVDDGLGDRRESLQLEITRSDGARFVTEIYAVRVGRAFVALRIDRPDDAAIDEDEANRLLRLMVDRLDDGGI